VERREGNDVTIVAAFTMVHTALAVEEELASEKISIEVINPRIMYPLDKEIIISSLEKIGRLITVTGCCKTNGVDSAIASVVAEESIDCLLAPIISVAAPMTLVPYGAVLERFYLPDEGNIKDAVSTLLQYA
jgi:pyruvate dehydrogenase E1 component beta subunit